MDERRYLDLPGESVTLLSNPPVGEKALLELMAEWPELDAALVEVAESVRLFVLTWDPLDWLPGRPDYFHARNAADDRGDAELVIYFTVAGLKRMLDTGRDRSTVAGVLGGVATGLVAAAAESPAPQPLPTIGMVSPGWEPIGLGAITDVAVHAFGPVDLDRSPVTLPRASKHDDACPACRGQQFGFIADMMEATAFMCLEHRGVANAVVGERFRRAEVSNRLGWEAIVRASKRLSAPMRRPRPVAGGRPGPRPGARPTDRRRKRRRPSCVRTARSPPQKAAPGPQAGMQPRPIGDPARIRAYSGQRSVRAARQRPLPRCLQAIWGEGRLSVNDRITLELDPPHSPSAGRSPRPRPQTAKIMVIFSAAIRPGHPPRE